MLLRTILGSLAGLSLLLTLWQWWVARRFPLHRRLTVPPGFAPPVTLLKPVKGCDAATESCLRSWLSQKYPGNLQVLFAVASADDPVCAVIKKLLAEFPTLDVQLVMCGPLAGTNLKVAKLAQIEPTIKHELVVVSDADVRVPTDLLTELMAPLQDPTVGLVNCFYRLANPTTQAMDWEAIAINADFWSQVLQAQSLKPLDFALGAVMAFRREDLRQIGGFMSLIECLADDYQLGHRIAQQGQRIALAPVVVECWCEPMGWRAVWRHQLRWARTIRVCQPLPYFFSVLSNGTLWPLLFLAAAPTPGTAAAAFICWAVRAGTALDLKRRLEQGRFAARFAGLVLLKDLLQTAIWVSAFLGQQVEWRGERFSLRRDGTLVRP